MSEFDFSTLVTDRTQSDVTALKKLLSKPYSSWTEEEKAQFSLASSKGAYNYTDLNRVSTAIYALDEMLRRFGYKTGVEKVPVPHGQYEGYDDYTWYETDVPASETMGKYLENLSKLRSVIIAPASTPAIPSDMDGLTVTEANNIEKIIADLNQLLINMPLAWFYSGELYAGEV